MSIRSEYRSMMILLDGNCREPLLVIPRPTTADEINAFPMEPNLFSFSPDGTKNINNYQALR